jgi:hypothetical protein
MENNERRKKIWTLTDVSKFGVRMETMDTQGRVDDCGETV